MKYFLSAFASLILICCGKVKQIDTTELKDIMEQSVVTKISDKELLVIAESTADEQQQQINKFIIRGECDSLNIPNVRYINLEKIAPSPYEKQQRVLEAYAYQYQNKKELGKNVQQVQDTLYFFTSPLAEETNACLQTKDSQILEIKLSKSELVKKIVSNKN